MRQLSHSVSMETSWGALNGNTEVPFHVLVGAVPRENFWTPRTFTATQVWDQPLCIGRRDHSGMVNVHLYTDLVRPPSSTSLRWRERRPEKRKDLYDLPVVTRPHLSDVREKIIWWVVTRSPWPSEPRCGHSEMSESLILFSSSEDPTSWCQWKLIIKSRNSLLAWNEVGIP